MGMNDPYVLKIYQRVKETEEAFIFENIKPYCEEITQCVLEKKDLKDALASWMARKWINVKDRRPEEGQVLVYMAWGGCAVAQFEGTRFYTNGHFNPVPAGVVTHWMPLPEPPKEATLDA